MEILITVILFLILLGAYIYVKSIISYFYMQRMLVNAVDINNKLYLLQFCLFVIRFLFIVLILYFILVVI